MYKVFGGFLLLLALKHKGERFEERKLLEEENKDLRNEEIWEGE